MNPIHSHPFYRSKSETSIIICTMYILLFMTVLLIYINTSLTHFKRSQPSRASAASPVPRLVWQIQPERLCLGTKVLRWSGQKNLHRFHFPVASLLLQWNPQNTQVSRLCNQGDKVSADSVGSPENRCGLLGSLKTMSSSTRKSHGWKHYGCGTSIVGKSVFASGN